MSFGFVHPVMAQVCLPTRALPDGQIDYFTRHGRATMAISAGLGTRS